MEPDPQHEPSLVDRRVALISGISVLIGWASSYVALWLVKLIYWVTNLSFFGHFSLQPASPAQNALGLWVILIPVAGGLIVGLMARYGSKAIRGHGIPEAMEQVLTNESRIPPRVLVLKPLSAAVAIGTGGPFGAEGPIISTGGALGSLVGQLLETTAMERKTLLAAGAAAGMTAIFATPVSAVLLAIELLLFEYRPRSVIPVALASVASMSMRIFLLGPGPVFPMAGLAEPGRAALAGYVAIGGVVGVLSVWITRLVYRVEDGFDRLPIHWMWWPAIGAVAVGVIGAFAPRTLGVGYDNIENILDGALSGRVLFWLGFWKLASWSLSLGSGTSGGTLAPLFTIGGACGALLGEASARWLPAMGIDPRIAGLVGMAAIFSGASRALLASVVFAFEATRQPISLLPLLGGGTAAYFVSCALMRSTIMTEKIVRRGIHVPSEYVAENLDQILAGQAASKRVVALQGDDAVGETRRWILSDNPDAHYQGFPVVDAEGNLLGVATRREIFSSRHPEDSSLSQIVRRPAIVAYEDSSLRQARDLMVQHGLGRLPVVSRQEPRKLAGILSKSDILGAHRRVMEQSHVARRTIDLRIVRFGKGEPSAG